MRARVVNPKWIAGVKRHGYKGAFEIAATVDYMFAFAATTGAVKTHHFDLAFEAFIADAATRDFIAANNPAALAEIAAALQRGDRAELLDAAIQLRPRSACTAWREGARHDRRRDAYHAEKMQKKKAARDKIMATKTIEKGLLIVHTGKGKGKSTAAFGMVFRAIGHGMRGRRHPVREGRVGDGRAHRAREVPRSRDDQGDGRRLHLGDAGPRARCRAQPRRRGTRRRR